MVAMVNPKEWKEYSEGWFLVSRFFIDKYQRQTVYKSRKLI